MNIFFRVGDKLLTSPTNDRILDGVTRKSIIQLAKDNGVEVVVEKVSVKEIVNAAKNGELKEIFGAGTAATVVRVDGFEYDGEYYDLPTIDEPYGTFFKKSLQDIQYNKVEDPHGWTMKAF
jgi:branched-chain amino acid aminotransferase